MRRERLREREPRDKAWKIAVKYYSIEEAKLEADADARSKGREKALRDVLVYVNTPRSLEDTPPLPEVYANAHYIWYVFTGVGFTAFLAMLVFKYVTNRIDRRRALAGGGDRDPASR